MFNIMADVRMPDDPLVVIDPDGSTSAQDASQGMMYAVVMGIVVAIVVVVSILIMNAQNKSSAKKDASKVGAKKKDDTETAKKK